MQINKVNNVLINKQNCNFNKKEIPSDLVLENNEDYISKVANEAIKNRAVSSFKIKKTAKITQSGHNYSLEGKYKIIDKIPTDRINAEWRNRGYLDCPYKEGQQADIIELTKETVFVRVYDKETSGMKGSWIMKLEDVKGKSPEQIADDFSLPKIPKYICDVKLPQGTKLRTGECNPLYGRAGGGIQYDLMGERIGEFSNERLL